MTLISQGYELKLGQLFEEKYRIVRELGRGGFGMVYLAHQVSMDRHVALKILKPGVGAQAPSARERFLREVKIISRLRHPNTVTIHDYGETHDGVVYMVLEYVEGATLKEMLKREGAQTPYRALMLVRQIARSLAEAHRHGVVHRDLKPANLMVMDLETETDFVKVLDFGVARLLNQVDNDLTSAGVPDGERALIGTPRYMSPEQVRGEDLTGASDIYSLGLIFYELLAGEPAVQGDTTMGLISQQLSSEPLKLPNLHAIHPAVQPVIGQATNKVIGRRFRSAEEFGDAIDHALGQIVHEQGPSANSGRSFYHTSGAYAAVSGSGRHQSLHPSQNHQPIHYAPQHQNHVHQPYLQNQGPQQQQQQQQQYAHNPRPQESSLPLMVKSTPTVMPSNLGQLGLGGAPHPQDDPMGLFSSDMPPPPDAAGPSPFAPLFVELHSENDESLELEKVKRAKGTVAEDKILSDTLRITLYSLVAIFGIYMAFIFAGAIFDEWLDGYQKLFAALTLAIMIPLATALGENSKKERFEVVTRPEDRIVRICIGSAIISFMSALLISFAMSGTVTDQLRYNPNWFFPDGGHAPHESTGLARVNYEMSGTLADIVETTTRAIGIYEGTRSQREPSTPTPTIVRPPEPTRPATRPGTPASTRPGRGVQENKGTDEEKAVKGEAPANPLPAPTKSSAVEAETSGSERSTPPSRTRPAAPKEKEEGDYVRW